MFASFISSIMSYFSMLYAPFPIILCLFPTLHSQFPLYFCSSHFFNIIFFFFVLFSNLIRRRNPVSGDLVIWDVLVLDDRWRLPSILVYINARGRSAYWCSVRPKYYSLPTRNERNWRTNRIVIPAFDPLYFQQFYQFRQFCLCRFSRRCCVRS